MSDEVTEQAPETREEQVAREAAEAKAQREQEIDAIDIEATLAGVDRIEIEKDRGNVHVKVPTGNFTKHGHGKSVREALYDAGYR